MTETTTVSRDPTDTEPQIADRPVVDPTVAAADAAGPPHPEAVPESPHRESAAPASEPPEPPVAEAAPDSPRRDSSAPEPPSAEPTTAAAPVQAAPVQAAPVQAAPVQAAPVPDTQTQPALIPIIDGPPPIALHPETARPLFRDLGLSEEVLRAIDDMGYRHPTPIQEQAIPYVLMGRDVMGTAQTGTGKTAGFTLPMLDILSGSRARARMPRSLILEPTRELALQVAENFVQYGKYLKLTHALIIGGESMSDQKDVLNRGVDVLIATPGRLLDMFDRGTILLSDTKLLVIDEADRMLDMGFIPDVERIVSMLPSTRQTLFFSATMGPEIRRLVDAFLTNPKEIAVSRAASVATTITEGLALVAEHDKREALRRLIRSQNVQNALIFCNRKKDVDILHKSLTKHHFDAGALHGDMAQTVRFSTLEKFKANELRLLVCSDVAARGLDIGGLSHVFNFDVPIHAEDYVHRIGRTGRAGLEGRAFTIAAPEDRFHVEQIEKLIHHAIPPIIVEGLDPVDWAEGRGKRRSRKSADSKRPPAKAPPAKVKAREAAEPAEKPRTPRKRPDHARPERIRTDDKQPELAIVAERPARREESRRDHREESRRDHREESRRDHREDSRRDEPRRPRDESPRPDTRRPDTGRPDTGRADTGRPDTGRAEPRFEEPRRDDYRRDRYRRDDDLGPAVVGFGEDVPAFMFLRTRPPHAADNRDTDA